MCCFTFRHGKRPVLAHVLMPDKMNFTAVELGKYRKERIVIYEYIINMLNVCRAAQQP